MNRRLPTTRVSTENNGLMGTEVFQHGLSEGVNGQVY